MDYSKEDGFWSVGEDSEEVYPGLDEAILRFVEQFSEDEMPDIAEAWEYDLLDHESPDGHDCEPTGKHAVIDILAWLKSNDYDLYSGVMSLR